MMKLIDLNKPFWQWVILLILAFIWGSSFILMKKGLIAYSHDEVATLRMAISFICFLPYILYQFKKVPKKYWLPLLVVGLSGNGIPAYLFTKAETGLSSSLTGMLNSLVPLFTIILGVTIFKIKTNKLKFIGVFIGLIGAVILLSANGLDLNNSEFSFGIYVIIATICYAISVNTIKKYLQELNALTVSSFAFLFIGPPVIIYGLTTNIYETTVTHPYALSALGFIAILSIVGTAISLILFNLLVQKTSAIFASTVTYLIPAFAIFWGIFDGEIINLTHFIGIIIILTGIFFVNRFK